MSGGLACRNISYSYPSEEKESAPILKDISHVFSRNRSTLIIGATGSGKSTLLHLLAGLIRPCQGEIAADDRPVSRWTSQHLDRWRRTVGLVFQEPHLLPDATVRENAAAPLIPLGIDRYTADRHVMDLLHQLDLTHLAVRRAKLLSGGERQRLTLARALIIRPSYLLADEPTAFQDDLHTSAIVRLLVNAQDRGACVIVCSHDLRLAETGGFETVLKLAQGRLEIVRPCGTRS